MFALLSRRPGKILLEATQNHILENVMLKVNIRAYLVGHGNGSYYLHSLQFK
jgi:hypothetical protein